MSFIKELNEEKKAGRMKINLSLSNFVRDDLNVVSFKDGDLADKREFKLNMDKYFEEVINTLRGYDFTKIKNKGYIHQYKRTFL